MTKKKEVKDVEKLTASETVSGEVVTEVKVKAPLILPLTVDFGREDLNTMGIKLNEVIDFINNNN